MVPISPREVAARSRRFLVAGGSGFLGSHLVRALVGEGLEVHVPTTAKEGLPWRLRDVTGGLHLHHDVDLTGDTAAYELLADVAPSVVFNLAAHGVVATQRSTERMTAVNVTAAALLAEAVLRTGVEQLVHMGTGLEYGRTRVVHETTPLDAASRYGATKAAASVLLRQLARHEGLPAVVVRSFAAYGPAEPAEKLVPHVALSALRHEEVRITHGEQVREYLYVGDLVAGLRAAAAAQLPGGTEVNLSGQEPIRILDLAQLVVRAVGTNVPIHAGALELARPEYDILRADTTCARDMLGWQPRVMLAEGLRRTVEWYRGAETSQRGSA